MRATSLFGAGVAAALVAGGCASPPSLTAVAPATATQQLSAARVAFARDPQSLELRLAFGRAQFEAHDDAEARRTLEPLLAMQGELGERANLYAGAAAQRLGDLSDARVEFLRYLALLRENGGRSDADVEGRLGDISRAEAVSAAQTAIKNEIALNPASFPTASVGVSPLTVVTDDSTLMPLGYGLADLLIADLAVSPELQVVDRVHVDAILRELDLARSGRVDATTAPKLGRLIGASRLVNGAITPLAKSKLTVDARITSVEKGAFLGQPVTQQTSLNDILDAEKTLALSLFTELGVTLTPAQRAAVERRPTRYLSAFLAYARGAAAEANWQLDAAESYYAAAVSIDPGFALAHHRLSGVRANSARPRLTQLPLAPENWEQNILGGVTQGINPSPGDVLGASGNTTNAPLGGALSAASKGNVVIIIGTPP